MTGTVGLGNARYDRVSIMAFSALHQFDTDAIRRGNVTKRAAIHALFQLDRKNNAFRAELIAECPQVTTVQKSEMIRSPFIVA